MSIPLPNLDDRRWADLVEQARAQIPLYAPEWTDHNASDPGITLIELMAWVTEMDIYRLNRITPAQTLRMLALMNVRPQPPRAASVACALRLTGGVVPLTLPARTRFRGTLTDGTRILLRTSEPVDLAGASLKALLRKDGTRMHNMTPAWQRGEALALLGDDPAPGASFYLGFDQALPPGIWNQLYVGMHDDHAGSELRGGVHHSARVVWEYLVGPSDWRSLEVKDATRTFTLSGAVGLRSGQPMQSAVISPAAGPLYWIRCRMAAGAFDAAPQAVCVLANGVQLLQSVPISSSWPIAPGTVTSASITAGHSLALRITIDSGQVVALAADPTPDAPQLLVLDYQAATGVAAGLLAVEGSLAGIGNGEPGQRFSLRQRPVTEASVRLFSVESGGLRSWQQVDGFTASTRVDAHFHLDPAAGTVTLGDGEHGRVLTAGDQLFASYEAAVVAPALATVDGLADGATIEAGPPWTIDPGAAAETLFHATGRAVEAREARLRAVTTGDYEAIARATPGLRVARAIARPNLYPGLDCVRAPGMVTLVVLPHLPRGRPMPSPGFIDLIAERIEARRMLGTRVVVTGPRYLEVAVRARIRAFDGSDRNGLAARVAKALDAFFDPLTGGPDGEGWPLGRDVYRTEVMQVIDQTCGVDHVLALELIAEDCAPSCGNVCLRPTSLVHAGTHNIEVA